MGNRIDDDNVEFLKSYLEKLQERYEIVQELFPQDFCSSGDDRPQTPDDAERCARIADYHGFEGSLFRNISRLDVTDGAKFAIALKELRKKIETIPSLIDAIEKGLGIRWSQFLTLKDIEKIFDIKRDALLRQIAEGNIRVRKINDKCYQLDIRDTPKGWVYVPGKHSE